MMKNRIAIILVIAIVSIMALTACGLVKDMTTVNNLGKTFMASFRDSDPASSWQIMTSDLQEELVDVDSWAIMIAPYTFSEWSFSNTQVEKDQAMMEGEATLAPDSYTVELTFVKENDTWLVAGFDIAIIE
jgi:hypothetical protein